MCKPKLNLQTAVKTLTKKENGRWSVNDSAEEFDAVVLSLDPSVSDITLTSDSPDEQTLLTACQSVQYEDVVVYFHEDARVRPKSQNKSLL